MSRPPPSDNCNFNACLYGTMHWRKDFYISYKLDRKKKNWIFFPPFLYFLCLFPPFSSLPFLSTSSLVFFPVFNSRHKIEKGMGGNNPARAFYSKKFCFLQIQFCQRFEIYSVLILWKGLTRYLCSLFIAFHFSDNNASIIHKSADD